MSIFPRGSPSLKSSPLFPEWITRAIFFGCCLFSPPLIAGTESSSPPPAPKSGPLPAPLTNQDPSLFETDQDDLTHQNWMLHAQNTDLVQGQPGFRSPYAGPYSVYPNDGVRQTISLDLFLGAHLWPGGELYFNPEYYQGFGFANSHGFADFSNGEAFKTGESTGGAIIAHLFYRQTFGLGGEQEQLSSDQLQLAKKVDVSRIAVTMGRFEVTDLFDNNSYANSPRTQFMNYSLIQSGAFDYSSDAINSTEGIAIDFNQKDFAILLGGFMVDQVQNGLAYDGHITRAWQDDLEFDQRFSIANHPGVVRLIAWLSSIHSGTFALTLADPANNLDPTQTQKYRYEYGFALNAEQEITADLGAFFRISYRNGQTPEWSFTDIDRNVSTGLHWKGTPWKRPDDVIGYGLFLSGLSNNSREFFAAGGQGLTIGDGALNYQPEEGLETYYSFQVAKYVTVSADYQLIVDPGYNVDRGPINIFSARLHLEY